MSTSTIESEKSRVRELFEQFVVPSYGRFDIELERGQGSYVWDVAGRRYLDFGAGIAVSALGHGNEEIADALYEQARKLVHVSNLYYTAPQAELAERLVQLTGPGRVFFCNSGAEANEGLYKLARRVGHDAGRFEIITATDSFHGRTLAGIAATGQDKVKKGFGPAVPGFKHVPFNDLHAVDNAITNSTIAVLIEPVQGESGVTIARPEYLRGLRVLCDQRNLLLMFDEVQAGHFRTGQFQSWQTIMASASPESLEGQRPDGGVTFLPDAVSMAKALGGGFPMGAFWVRDKYSEALSAGSHASTFGGTPLACAVALRVLDVIERDTLAENACSLGEWMLERLRELATETPHVIEEVRGLGLMIGMQFNERFAAIDVVTRLHQRGVLTIPAGKSVVRLLPPLNLSRAEAEDGLRLIELVIRDLAE